MLATTADSAQFWRIGQNSLCYLGWFCFWYLKFYQKLPQTTVLIEPACFNKFQKNSPAHLIQPACVIGTLDYAMVANDPYII